MARSDLIKDLVSGDLRFFICTAPENEIKKTSWISKTNMKTIHNVKLKDNCSSLEPVFILKSDEDLFTYNYCYFYNTKRFYYMSEPPILLTQGQMEIHCKVDALYSWIQEIGDCMAFEDRSSNIGTGYIQDEEIIFNASPQGEVFEFTNSVGSKVFKDHSYLITIANNLAFASKFAEGDEPVNDPDYINYPQPQYTTGDHAAIQAIFDKIDEWRLANWQYSQNKRNQNNYCDCSSLIARAMITALNLTYSYGGETFLENGTFASAIAYWFVTHPDYAYNLQNGSGQAGTSLLSGKCFENAYQIRPGDLIFYIDNTRKDRFPSCWESNSLFEDGSSYFDNEYYCRDVFGASAGKIDGHKMYGITHIAICHDCHMSKFSTYHALKGYKVDANNKLVADSTATAKKPDHGDCGLWVLECLPEKNGYTKETNPDDDHYNTGWRTLTTYINGTVKTLDCSTNRIGAGNILYKRENDSHKITSNIGQNGELEEVTDVAKFDYI